jgi:hypothetical protein
MSDVDGRLAALDPAADQPYHHANLDAMITRIVTAPSRATSSRWQRLQARLAFGAIAASLVTALTLVATQGAPSLSALAIARALETPSASNFSTATPMQAFEDVHFSAGPQIASTTPSVASYKLKLPANPSTEAKRVAKVFGVSGAVKRTAFANGFAITSASGAAISYWTADVPQFEYSSTSPKVAPAEESGSASVAMPSHAAVESLVRHYVAQLGYNYALSSPSFSTATTSTTTPSGAPLTVSSETASYAVIVHGVRTDQSISFTVDPADRLLYAEGPAFDASTGVRYPLVNPLAGVAELNTAEDHSFSATAKPPSAKATLARDTVSLASYQLKNGTLWLLPLYTYSGSVAPVHGTTAMRTWSELAVEPTYVTGVTAAAPGIGN